MNWGTYNRISEDPDDTQRGVGRQDEDTRAAVAKRDGKAVKVYTENDTSAYKKKRVQRTDDQGHSYYVYRVIRPVWQQALSDLRSGKIDALMVWDLDRLARDPRDLEDAIEVVQHYGKRIESVTGSIDLMSDAGIAMARVLVAMANKSSADTGRRVKRAHLENAKQGVPVGGFRPFGWKDDKRTLDPKESRLVREAVEGILGGGSLRSVLREWNGAGVTTSTGGPWKLATLRQYLRSPRLVGYRTHSREVLLDGDGRPVQGQWEPMLDKDTYDRLQLLLAKPDTRARVPRRNARHYLLTGVVRCGVCSALMYGNARGDGRYDYMCNNPAAPTKHSLGISGTGLDDLIRDLILAKLANETVTVEPAAWPGEDELAEAKGQIESLMSAFMDKTLSGDIVFPRVKVLEEKVAGMTKDRAEWLSRTTGPVSRAYSLEEWEELDLDVKQGHVEKLLDAVLIRPARQRQNRLDHERVVPVWREVQQARLAVVH